MTNLSTLTTTTGTRVTPYLAIYDDLGSFVACEANPGRSYYRVDQLRAPGGPEAVQRALADCPVRQHIEEYGEGA